MSSLTNEQHQGKPRKAELLSRNAECGICFESSNQHWNGHTVTGRFDVGHWYCSPCIQKAENQCPSCREPLTDKNSYHAIFLENNQATPLIYSAEKTAEKFQELVAEKKLKKAFKVAQTFSTVTQKDDAFLMLAIKYIEENSPDSIEKAIEIAQMIASRELKNDLFSAIVEKFIENHQVKRAFKVAQKHLKKTDQKEAFSKIASKLIELIEKDASKAIEKAVELGQMFPSKNLKKQIISALIAQGSQQALAGADLLKTSLTAIPIKTEKLHPFLDHRIKIGTGPRVTTTSVEALIKAVLIELQKAGLADQCEVCFRGNYLENLLEGPCDYLDPKLRIPVADLTISCTGQVDQDLMALVYKMDDALRDALHTFQVEKQLDRYQLIPTFYSPSGKKIFGYISPSFSGTHALARSYLESSRNQEKALYLHIEIGAFADTRVLNIRENTYTPFKPGEGSYIPFKLIDGKLASKKPEDAKEEEGPGKFWLY